MDNDLWRQWRGWLRSWGRRDHPRRIWHKRIGPKEAPRSKGTQGDPVSQKKRRGRKCFMPGIGVIDLRD